MNLDFYFSWWWLMIDQGMWLAMFVCFILGIGSLLTWNSMLTIVDYYAYLFPVYSSISNKKKWICWLQNHSYRQFDLNFWCLQEYHPTRILVLVFQPFSLLFVSILAYNEARINTRLRNLVGYTIFFLSSLAVIIVSLLWFFIHRKKIKFYVHRSWSLFFGN